MTLVIGLASDHGGKELKKHIADFLRATDCEVLDFGVEANYQGSVDYPDYAEKLARALLTHKIDKGIGICGTGIGISMALNKVPGIRAGVVWDEFTARMAAMHNNLNILCLGGRVVNYDRAQDFIKIWLETKFEGGRHQTRVEKIAKLETQDFSL